MNETILLDEATLANPYATYAALRERPGLVRHARERYFLVARYDDVREAALRTEDFSSRIVEVLARSVKLGGLVGDAIVRFGPVDVLAVEDAPAHLVHRKLGTRHFARESVDAIIARAMPGVESRLDAYVSAGGGDFMTALAGSLPVEIAMGLLGFPLSDAPYVKRMSDHSVALLSGLLPSRDRVKLLGSGLGLYAYSLARFELARRRGGAGTPLGDALVEATREGRIGVREAASIVMQILIAGSDSTASLLGSAARILAEDPALAERLRADPMLVAAFVEETLRLESPFQGHFRVVRRATTLAGQALVPGDRLMLLWASANRDPSVFADPDAIVLDRKRGTKPQMAFGQGIHLCLGAGLARGVATGVLERLLARTSDITLRSGRPSDALRYKPSGFVRTLEAVPLVVRGCGRASSSSSSSASSSASTGRTPGGRVTA